MFRLFRFIFLLAVCAVFLPRPVAAQDGCGLWGLIAGCTQDQQALQAEREHQQVQAQMDAQAQAAAQAAQQQAQQLEYQRWLASEQAQQELTRIAARERVDMAQIQAQLEQMYAQERINAVNATTSFNVAALQSEAMIAVAASRAEAARAEQATAALMALAVLAIAGALAYAAWQYRRASEKRAQPLLLLWYMEHMLPPGTRAEIVPYEGEFAIVNHNDGEIIPYGIVAQEAPARLRLPG